MKTVIVLCLLCATAYAFPANSEEESNESDFFRPLSKKGVSSVDVDGTDSDEDSFFFPAFFRPILINPFPKFNFGGGFSNLFPSSMFRWGSLFNMFGGVPEDAKVTNATSTVKVVDGQRVTVNVTTYEKDGAIFKYEVVEVVRDRPEGEDNVGGDKPVVTTSEETVTKKAESEETSSPKNDNNSLDNEIFREEFNRNNWENNGGYRPRMHLNYRDYNRHPAEYIDLSNDIRVNEIANAAAINSGTFQLPPDVEVFDVPRPNYRYETPSHGVYQYRYDSPQNWHFNSLVYDYQINRIPHLPSVNNVQYYSPQSPHHFLRQPLPPPNSYNYQQRFANPF